MITYFNENFIYNIYMPVSDQLSAEKHTNSVSSPSIACTVDVPIEGVAGTHTSAAAVEVERVVDTSNIKYTKGTCTLHNHLLAI